MAKYGEAWGWPRAMMSYEADKQDLARHQAEIAAHETFNHAIFAEPEAELFGCVYIDPPSTQSPRGSDAMASWWVVKQLAGNELERTLDDFIPHWLADTWGFEAIHYFP